MNQRDSFSTRDGEKFRYSNQGFAYLQLAMEQLTGVSFAQHLQESVLQPLGMTGSSLDWCDQYQSKVADLHNGDGTVHDPGYSFYKSHHNQAFHGLLTTPSAYAQFVCQISATFGHSRSGWCFPDAETNDSNQ